VVVIIPPAIVDARVDWRALSSSSWIRDEVPGDAVGVAVGVGVAAAELNRVRIESVDGEAFAVKTVAQILSPATAEKEK
jgi:hypothetical protein